MTTRPQDSASGTLAAKANRETPHGHRQTAQLGRVKRVSCFATAERADGGELSLAAVYATVHPRKGTAEEHGLLDEGQGRRAVKSSEAEMDYLLLSLLPQVGRVSVWAEFHP